MLAFALFTMVVSLPRIVGTAWHACTAQRAVADYSWHHGDTVAALAHWLAAVIVLLPLAAGAVLLVRLGRSLVRSLLRRTAGRPVRRGLSFLLVAALIAGLAWSWWPRPGRYEPIKPWERGSLLDTVALARPSTQLGVGTEGRATVVWPSDKPVPTRDHPQLALVLVPRPGSSSGETVSPTGPTSDGTTSSTTDPSTWVFPVDLPLAPGPGDNQAVAVNTTDGSVVYDTAFALVWDSGGDVADNTNQAYALASCTDCAAVSVAFQVVLVVGQTSAAVPQNVSVAVNSGCVGCLTYALAVQLFVTLDGPLDDSQMAALRALWAQIQDYGQHIAEQPLSDIQAQLNAYEQQILAIVAPDSVSTASPSSTTATATTGTSSAYPTDGSSAAASPGATSGTAPPATEGSTAPAPTSGATSSSAEPTSPSSPTSSAPESSSVATLDATPSG
jgi:putative peptide zinc metalloprotease protein